MIDNLQLLLAAITVNNVTIMLTLLLQAAPTIVMTQRGARQGFQAHLRSRGVEVVEFDFLTPDNVADYCYERGFLQVCAA
jgi:hypothetical protein